MRLGDMLRYGHVCLIQLSPLIQGAQILVYSCTDLSACRWLGRRSSCRIKELLQVDEPVQLTIQACGLSSERLTDGHDLDKSVEQPMPPFSRARRKEASIAAKS